MATKKQSGYSITISTFIPADLSDNKKLESVQAIVMGACDKLVEIGGKNTRRLIQPDRRSAD